MVHLACLSGQLETAKWLVTQGANPLGNVSQRGAAPLRSHMAEAEGGHSVAVEGKGALKCTLRDVRAAADRPAGGSDLWWGPCSSSISMVRILDEQRQA